MNIRNHFTDLKYVTSDEFKTKYNKFRRYIEIIGDKLRQDQYYFSNYISSEEVDALNVIIHHFISKFEKFYSTIKENVEISKKSKDILNEIYNENVLETYIVDETFNEFFRIVEQSPDFY